MDQQAKQAQHRFYSSTLKKKERFLTFGFKRLNSSLNFSSSILKAPEKTKRKKKLKKFLIAHWKCNYC